MFLIIKLFHNEDKTSCPLFSYFYWHQSHWQRRYRKEKKILGVKLSIQEHKLKLYDVDVLIVRQGLFRTDNEVYAAV